jgi:hypothetical protein
VIDPPDFEKSIGEARLLVGSRVEKCPVDLVELGETPGVDATHVLDLGLLVGVGKGGATKMAQLGRYFTRDGPVANGQADSRSWEEGNKEDWCGLSPEVFRCNNIATRVELHFPG